MSFKTTLAEELGTLDEADRTGTVTVVFGDGISALRGRIVGRRTDYFVLAADHGGVEKLHLVRWGAVAYVRREEATA